MSYDKLSQLGPRLFGEKVGDLEAALQSAERILPLSRDYRRLLQTIGGPIVFDKGAKFLSDEKSPLNDKDGYQILEVLYGLGDGSNSIEKNAARYAGELPPSFVPIGETPGGNLICMDADGAVHLWDHESCRNGATWRIAPTLDEFLNRLEPDDSKIGSTEAIIDSKSSLDF